MHEALTLLIHDPIGNFLKVDACSIYGHDNNEWFRKDVSRRHSSMQINMNLLILFKT